MHLKRLIAKDYRNIASADITFSPGMNCISGDNGMGKTNLLDAVWYLSMTRSLISPNDRYTCREGGETAVLHGEYERGGEVVNVAVSVSKGGEKILKSDGKTCPKLSAHIGRFPVVAVSPSDSSLVSESGEERRRFLNILLSQTDGRYLSELQKYNRALMQRNKILKESGGRAWSPILMDTFSEQLSESGTYVYKCRREVVEKLSSLACGFCKALSDGTDDVSMTYSSDLERGGMSELLAASAERDKVLQYTTVGVQRDDIVFVMDGRKMRNSASQGQQKTFLIALKMAQYSYMKEIYGFAPILLLDDIFDKLDERRAASMLKMVSEEGFGQIVITDTDASRVREILGEMSPDCSYYKVASGNVERLG